MRLFLCSVIALTLLGCSSNDRNAGNWEVTEVSSPAVEGSGEPYLFAADGKLWMSWLEGSKDSHALKFAQWNGSDWNSPSTIESNVPFFVNWADFPSFAVLDDGTYVAHWLEMAGKGAYAYHVKIAHSQDGGKTWSEPASPHSDTSENEHGFASIVPLPEGEFSVVWLDGRKFKADGHDPSNEMTLMSAVFRDGVFSGETVVDGRVCDCCQTDAAKIKDGVIAVYRDRSESEVRDIYYSRWTEGKWSQPQVLHADNWKINACPVNGPAVSTAGDLVTVAWFTGAEDKPKVQAVFSKDGGKTFGAPVRIDQGSPSGRVDVVLLRDGSAVVSWLENTESGGAEVRIRRITPDGRADAFFVVADSSSARSSGFPRLAMTGDDLFVAWTYAGDRPKIRMAKLAVS